jgi:2,4-dienoyl-CoA reductase-like NADH-dependent reductase (Old Yellow Enzyme family)
MATIAASKEAGMAGPADSEAFASARVGGLELRNRVIRAGCYEGLAREGNLTEALLEHHRQLAAGGLAMTTLGYCAVSFDGRGYADQLWARSELGPQLRQYAQAVHAEGAAASIQLVHCGFFSSPAVIGRRPLGASPKLVVYRGSVCEAMSPAQIEEKTADFARAAELVREAGLDALELHAGHGYLLSQFLSPWSNRRRDRFGGSLENRLRFPTEVVRRVRQAVGPDFPVLVKVNLRDGFRGGLELEEALRAAPAFEAAGASALVPSCGFTARTSSLYMMRGNVPIREMAANQRGPLLRLATRLFGRMVARRYPFRPLFLLEGSRKVAETVRIPVVYVGGVLSLRDMEVALQAGCRFVEVGRATVRDPAFVRCLRSGEITESDCDQCNRCIAAMEAGGVRCISAELGLMQRDRW